MGLMTGTSMDGLDIAIVDFSAGGCKLLHAETISLPENLKNQMTNLWHSSALLSDYGQADIAMGEFFAHAVNEFLYKHNLNSQDIKAIGSHGQTLWHAPEKGFTLQIGNPHVIAALTKIDVIADFRQADMVRAGQGAPLAPAFHAFAFSSSRKKRAIVNLGGIANVTILKSGEDVMGWDTGPANTLMDIWIAKHKNLNYDKNGDWAGSGIVNEKLLADFLKEEWLALPPPKSTGRELFNMEWLEKKLAPHGSLKACDIQATLLAFTAHSLAEQLKKTDIDEVFLCGGGVKNTHLVAYIEKLMAPIAVTSVENLGFSSDDLEAMIFAWYAKQFKENKPSSLPSVTGAHSACLLGALYPAIK